MSAMLDLDGIRVLVTRRSNAVRMKLSWQENRQWFTLSVPPGVRREDIMAFLRQSRPWMQEHQQKTDAHWQPLYAAG